MTMKRFSNRKICGQTSVVLVLLAAIALIFFAATLNWGRVSQIKNMTTTAATNAAANTVSGIASYGESLIQSQLDGGFEKSKFARWVVVALSFIAAALIIYFSGGAGSHWAAILITLAIGGAAATLLTVYSDVKTVRTFNEMQNKLPLKDRFLEQGLSAGAQSLTSDQSKIIDYFDMNTNGYFGPTNPGPDGKPDTVSRYGFFYTERLKALKKQMAGMDLTVFLDGLGVLMGEITEGCPRNPDGTPNSDPHCDKCCVPLTMDGKRLRPASCSTDPVPAQCASADPVYPFIYDPTYPKYSGGASFLAQFGVDSEKKPFNKDDAKGNFFPMLWDMSTITSSRFDTGSGSDGLKPDKIKYPDNTVAVIFDADGNGTPICAEDKDTSQGFWWRKGADQYCSTTWPYNECSRNACTRTSCLTCTPATAADWTEDPPDDLVYSLKGFYAWAKALLAQDDDTLNANLKEWYSEAAVWVGPECDGSNADICHPGGGLLYKYQGTLRTWALILSGWLNSNDADTGPLLAYYHREDLMKTYINPVAWCVPDVGTVPPDEAVHIYAGGKWGSLDGIIACQGYDAGNEARFNQCATDLDAIPPPPNVPASCNGLPADADNPPSFVPCSSSESGFREWLNDEINRVNARDITDGQGNVDPVKKAQQEQDLAALNTCSSDLDAIICPASLPPPPLPASCSGAHAFDACNKNDYLGWLAGNAQAIWDRDLRWYAVNDAEIDPDKRAQQEGDIRALVQCANDIAPLQCPTTVKPASCDSLPRSFKGAPPEFFAKADDPVKYGLYHDWVTQSAAMAASRAPALSSRKTFLESLRTETLASFHAAWDGKGDLDAFFSGDPTDPDPSHAPVPSLFLVLQNYHLYLDKMPNFLVYGWQSPVDPKTGAQHWHMVRAEGMGPGKCPVPGMCKYGSNDNHDNLPHIETDTGGFLWTRQHSELKDYDGRALMRITRWDEDAQAETKFNNTVPVWNFHFGNPASGGVPPTSAAGLAACQGQGLGIAGNYIINNGVAADKQSVRQAFMLNTVGSDPHNTIPPSCWNTVDTLLSQGTKTTVCAVYTGNRSTNHMEVKFVSCPAGAFNEKTLGN